MFDPAIRGQDSHLRDGFVPASKRGIRTDPSATFSVALVAEGVEIVGALLAWPVLL